MSSRATDDPAENVAWMRYCDGMDKRFDDQAVLRVMQDASDMMKHVSDKLNADNKDNPPQGASLKWLALKTFAMGLHLTNECQRDIMRQMAADIAALRVELSRKKALVYRGVHVAGEVYDTGDMVTYAGGIWHCNQITEARPGDGASAWTLAVKRGRDGKDATRATA